MIQPNSPYDDLKKEVDMLKKSIDYLIKAFDNLNSNYLSFTKDQIKFNQEIIDMGKNQKEIDEKLIENIRELERKLQPENPGDINNLYQNWDKDDTIN